MSYSITIRQAELFALSQRAYTEAMFAIRKDMNVYQGHKVDFGMMNSYLVDLMGEDTSVITLKNGELINYDEFYVNAMVNQFFKELVCHSRIHTGRECGKMLSDNAREARRQFAYWINQVEW